MTNSPFVLQIAQWKAEAILTKVLEAKGVTVARPHRATGIVPFYGEEGQEDTPQEYKFVLTFEDGKTMKAKYVIGADGKESMVSGGLNGL
jgi:2-polyprenyl-6-methoxyphenol hydroxylase-like FAD-dependent oxidoreductase